MKLIIDIDDNVYDDIEHNRGEYINTLNWAVRNGKPISTEGDLISRSALKKSFDGYTLFTANTVIEFIDSAPTVEPKTDILEQIIAEINTSNRGTCDYYIVDRIEEIINEYQKGGAE